MIYVALQEVNSSFSRIFMQF